MSAATIAAPPARLSSKIIFRFFAPLAISWIFMAVEAPVNVSVLSRLPDAVLTTAAFSMLMALALWIESPVIDLLSTSTTLTKDRASFVAIRRFSLVLMGIATGVHALVAATPLYWVVTVKILHFPMEIAEHARFGMILMIPWSAAIGWRRFMQGILIRFGRTRLVGFGTLVRVLTMTAVSVLMFFFAKLPGVAIAGTALVLAVSAEAAFVHWATRGVIRDHLSQVDPDLEPVTPEKLRRFHIPLTLTTMVSLSTFLMVGVAVAHAAHPVLGLAALQVAQSLLWLHRTVVFALPEVVITLVKDEESALALRRFCIAVGLITTGLLLFSWTTGLDKLFFARALGATEDEIRLAHIAFIAYALTPLVSALQSYVRGMLTSLHLTVSRLYAIVVGLVALVIGLVAGVKSGMEGVVVAGVALTVAMVIELAVLVKAWRMWRVAA